MKNKNILVWLLVVLAVAGAVFIGYTYRGTFLQGKMGKSCDGKGCPESVSQVNDAINRAEFAKLLAVAMEGDGAFSYECQKQVFSDVEIEEGWFANYVCYLTDKDIMKGYADGSFGPAKKVTRAEAAKILMKAYVYSFPSSGSGGSGTSPYTDVTEDTWYYSAVKSGATKGWFDVKPWVGAKFYPNNTLSKGRAQLWIDNFKKAIGK